MLIRYQYDVSGNGLNKRYIYCINISVYLPKE